MPETITLTRAEPTETYGAVSQHSWGLKITAVSNHASLDSRIFVMHENAPGSAYDGDRYSCVASTQQMKDLPADAPQNEGDEHIPFYRVSEVMFDCRSPELREELWEEIQAIVKDLVVNWLALEETEVVETVEIGA